MEWSEYYKNLTNRNIGLITKKQQNKLKNSCVAICGLGGLGGVIVEILARTGIESFKLLDHGKFDTTNSNRQIYSFTDTAGKLKTDVTEKFLKKINPAIKTEKYLKITKENVDEFLRDVDVIVLSVDDTIPCIILSRAARRLNIPLVEGWVIPYGNVRVFTRETPTLEEAYGFSTIGKDISKMSKLKSTMLMLKSIISLRQIRSSLKYYPLSAPIRLAVKGEGTNLSPLAWLTDSLMAMKVFKIILDWGDIALAPKFAAYDPFEHKIPKQRIRKKRPPRSRTYTTSD